jgi:integrase
MTNISTMPRGRNSAVILTDRLCEKRVAQRTKIYDRKCPGLYVSITTAGVAAFGFKFTNPETHKQSSLMLGTYNPVAFTVEQARGEAYALKGKGGAAVVAAVQSRKAHAVKAGVTVDQVIAERIEWMKTPIMKRDGEMRPRSETWYNIASHLRRLVSPRLGHMVANEVTKRDIARLSNDIIAGEFGVPSVANARHMRRAASGMFVWAAEAGRDYVDANPCVNLPKLDEEVPCDRVLTEDEIRTLWHGLDRPDMPWDRKTRLGIKFALVTMLRSTELLHIHRDELNPAMGTVDIPARRVKKRRVIQQPLSDLAMEILNESMGDSEFAFAGRFGDAPLGRQAMSGALKGTMKTVKGKKVIKSLGICELLGMDPFTTHDLRRTGATICGDLEADGVTEANISLCLDHQANKDEDGKPLPAITRKVYNLATRKRVERKRKVLDRWAAELRRIIEGAEMLKLAA